MGKKTDRSSKKKGNKGNRQGQSTSRVVNGQTYTPPMASDTDASETEEEPSPSRRSSGTKRSSKEVERKPSPVLAPLPRLTTEEYALFDKVKSGDVSGVEAVLGNMDINKANRDGYTVLHIAVHRQDEAMVDLFLNQPGIKLYDTILHAVKENNLSITQKLLAFHDKVDSEEKKELFMSYIGQAPPHTGSADAINPTVPLTSVQPGIISSILTDETRKGYSKPKPARSTAIESVERERKDKFGSEYHPVITALMLAAQVGSYPLMDLFYERGERLESSEYHHNLNCACDTCKKLEGDADLTKAYERFHLFNSTTQPFYICFLARTEKIDPVNYAISKIIKLRKMIERDLAFGDRYKPFIERLETFMTDLISLCRDTEETKVFLTPKDPEKKERLPHLYPRLWYTVGLEMRKFVAHPNTQNIVHKMWADDWPEWDTLGLFNQVFQVVMRIIGFPIVALILLFAQNTGLGIKLKTPVSRFLTYIGSYIFFVSLVWIQVYWPKQRCNHGFLSSVLRMDDSEEYECKERGPPNIGTECFIVVYVMSFYVGILKRNSVSWYWSMKWNWFELLGQVAFTATFGCWAWAWFWTTREENKLLIDGTQRLMWPHNCAEVLGDCFMSLASIIAFGQLFRFSIVFPSFGQVQVGVGKLMMDFLGAFLAYCSILVAFASGLLALYAPYKDFEGLDADGKPGKMDDTFSKIHTTFANLFWYLYGVTDHEPFKLLTWIHNSTPGDGTTGEKIEHTYTQYAGEGLYLGYHMIGNMMMFTMLVGYCTEKLKKVENTQTCWLFARTELYLTFIKDTVLPPPFNLSPTVVGCVSFTKFCRYLGKNDDPKAACSAKQCCYITGSEKHGNWRKWNMKYRPLILELIYRYGSFKGLQEGEAEATKDDFKDLGEELAELKAMFLSKKRGSGILGGESSPDDDVNKTKTLPPRKAWAKPRRMLAIGGATFMKRKVFKGKVTTVLPAPAPQPSRTMSTTEPGLLQYASSPSEPPLRRTPSLPHPSSKTKLAVATPSPQGSAPSQPSPSRTSPLRKDSARRSQPSPSRTLPMRQGSAHSQASPARTSPTPKKMPSTSTAPLEKKVSSKTLGGTGGRAPPTPPPMPKPISMTSMTTDDSEAADGRKSPPRPR